ncbi:hypothetical protein [Bacteroides sp. UBA939]|uniref:hypothetical protein n=1 Tax=Bacteroides sp. UBA939 TaxID=1946092 RepID=UPI0025C55AAC|nr:hypothetical protein [Bacteroides sp. UBA939]
MAEVFYDMSHLTTDQLRSELPQGFFGSLHLPPKYLKKLIAKYALVSKVTNVENLTVE